jgi:CheY-like chemotaxis protein
MPPPLSPSNIVLAEDNPADVGLVREALRTHNVLCDLRVISDGEEVVEFLDRLDEETKSACPDLILLDLHLPKRNGGEILNHLRSGGRCSEIPVIIMTSSDWAGDRQNGEKNGATHYFRKPLSLMEFMRLGELVRTVLNNAQPEDPRSRGTRPHGAEEP